MVRCLNLATALYIDAMCSHHVGFLPGVISGSSRLELTPAAVATGAEERSSK